MDNKYTGEVSLDICGKRCVLVYDWRSLSRIKSEYGDEALRDLKSLAPETLAGILAAGLAKHHPDMTTDAILDLSPPLVPMIAAIDKAVCVAYFGADGVREIDKAIKGVKKKTI